MSEDSLLESYAIVWSTHPKLKLSAVIFIKKYRRLNDHHNTLGVFVYLCVYKAFFPWLFPWKKIFPHTTAHKNKQCEQCSLTPRKWLSSAGSFNESFKKTSNQELPVLISPSVNELTKSVRGVTKSTFDSLTKLQVGITVSDVLKDHEHFLYHYWLIVYIDRCN